MSTKATLIATLADEIGAPELGALSGRADVLEVRADRVAEPDPEELRRRFGGRLLFTLRSRAEGGRSEDPATERARRLIAAAEHYDLVDLESERDLRPEILAAVPPERRVVSWHGPPVPAGELEQVFARQAAHPARLYKLVPAAERPKQALRPLALLHSLGRSDVVSFASGPAGAWTRLLAPRLGAPVLFGAAGAAAAPGQPTVEALRRDYGLPELPPVERLFGIVGRRVAGSLSPRLHNALYRELGIPALYLAFEVEAFGEFWLEVVESGSLEVLGFALAGLSVTAPHKELAVAVAGAVSPLAERIESANTLIFRDGVWEADSTDHLGVLEPLSERGVLIAGRAAAVIGAGGAGRSAAFSLARVGARVTVVNRSEERGRRAASRLGLDYVPLSELDPSRFELLVNATSLGRDDGDPLPFTPGAWAARAVVIDLVYRDGSPTPLLREAGARGAVVVDGREVLLHQAQRQFRLMTGRELPPDEGRAILDLPPLPAAGPGGER